MLKAVRFSSESTGQNCEHKELLVLVKHSCASRINLSKKLKFSRQKNFTISIFNQFCYKTSTWNSARGNTFNTKQILSRDDSPV